jgi:hypothetical protein
VNITPAMISGTLKRVIAEQEGRLAKLVEREDWREAGDKAAYLDGLRFASELVDMLRLEDKTEREGDIHVLL